jgi:hypothetical protein
VLWRNSVLSESDNVEVMSSLEEKLLRESLDAWSRCIRNWRLAHCAEFYARIK